MRDAFQALVKGTRSPLPPLLELVNQVSSLPKLWSSHHLTCPHPQCQSAISCFKTLVSTLILSQELRLRDRPLYYHRQTTGLVLVRAAELLRLFSYRFLL